MVEAKSAVVMLQSPYISASDRSRTLAASSVTFSNLCFIFFCCKCIDHRQENTTVAQVQAQSQAVVRSLKARRLFQLVRTC